MPRSSHIGKDVASAWVRANTDSGSLALDVGAGCGTYADLLSDHLVMDGVEPHQDYITQFGLKSKYRNVFGCSLQALEREDYCKYSLVIFGDVLEHVSISEAQIALDRCRDALTLVAVPYMLQQGAVRGVEWEIHKQPDLTDIRFRNRYPGFSLVCNTLNKRNRPVGGYYARFPLDQHSH